nr:hypothetical protein Itr_chr13CG00480 [Ipomoea trifida]
MSCDCVWSDVRTDNGRVLMAAIFFLGMKGRSEVKNNNDNNNKLRPRYILHVFLRSCHSIYSAANSCYVFSNYMTIPVWIDISEALNSQMPVQKS